MTGAFTGIRAVISPKQLMTDEMTGSKPWSALTVLPDVDSTSESLAHRFP
jgi:hypothetical protein